METYSPTNRGQCLVDADCAALPGCDQPDLVTCYRGSCYTGTLDDRCDGQENGFHLGDGGWCWGGRRDQPCYGDDEDGDEDGDEGPCDICDGRGVKADTVAGYTCETAAGEKVGDSNTHPAMAFAVFNTAADCLTAGHSWNAYTCEDAARFWAEDEDQWNLGWTCQFHQDFWDWGGEAGGCCNSHAPGSQCPVETSGDRSSSPSGTTNHGSGKGWCYSDLDDHVGCAASPSDCWAKCEDTYGDNLVAIDWVDIHSACYCQRDCECMKDVGNDEVYLITRDLAVASLPHGCGSYEGDGDDWYEDWMWENSCRPE